LDKTATPSSLDDDDYDGFDWEKTAAFKAIVDRLVVKTKQSRGLIRMCHHCLKACAKERKNFKHRGDFGNECLECTCTKNKGVCEQLLVDRGILGKDVGDGLECRSLSDREWFKVDHIMCQLFGFNTNWLLDRDVFVAGLEAKLLQLREES
jgi:hypothetical protein